jgi:hypothetical protein
MKNDKVSVAAKAWALLGSSALFCYLSILIAFWFTLMLALYPKFIRVVNDMNEQVLFRWLTAKGGQESVPVRAWLAVLCIFILLLGINLFVCVIDDVIYLARTKANNGGARSFMARLGVPFMHAAYILVLAGHFVSSSTGFKVSYDLQKGGTYKNAAVPFELKCKDIKIGLDKMNPMNGPNMVKSVRLVLQGGEFKGRELNVKVKQTVRIGGYLFSLNFRTKKNEGCLETMNGRATQYIPQLRVVENPGLKIIFLGAIVFFPGIVLRMFFRPWPRSS